MFGSIVTCKEKVFFCKVIRNISKKKKLYDVRAYNKALYSKHKKKKNDTLRQINYFIKIIVRVFMSEKTNFVCALIQKSIKQSNRKFIFKCFRLRLKAG